MPKLLQLLNEGGVTGPEDLVGLEVDELIDVGVKKLQAKKLIKVAASLFK